MARLETQNDDPIFPAHRAQARPRGRCSPRHSPLALAQLRIVVEGANFQPLPIAIPDFASSDPSFGREIAGIVRANLQRSGLFVPLDPASLPVQVGDVKRYARLQCLADGERQRLVMGVVERGGQISSSVRVWDTQQGSPGGGQELQHRPNSARRIAHIVSDAIYEQLTGGSGYFDTRVIYVAESGPKANRVRRLAIMDQDGANAQYLTDGSAMALTPRFSPNGDLVTYMNFADGNPQVYLLQLSSGRQQRLAAVGAMTFAPRFSPDGGTVVFSVEQSGATNIYAVGTGGGQPVQLTSGAAIDTSPSFSPDGSRIAFESDRGGSPQIYIMGSGGGNAQRISFGQGSYSTPVWYRRATCSLSPASRVDSSISASWRRTGPASGCCTRASTPRDRPGRPMAASSCSSRIRVATMAHG